MTFFRGRTKQALLLTAAALTVAGCSARGGVPHVDRMTPMEASTIERSVGRGLDNSRPAVRRVKLSGDFFALKPMGGDMPKAISDARVRIDFGGQTPTFDDLTMLLEDRGLSVVLGWDDGSLGAGSGASASSVEVSNTSNEGGANGGAETNSSQSVRVGSSAYNIRSRSLPFRRFEGTLGGLFRQLERSMGVTIWWNEGIYVSPVGRYSVMLPQNRELMQQVVTELEAKGATNVVASIQAGTVSFVAPGALAEQVIRPYLLRLGRNAAEVTMQVALVSVTMNEDTSRGFDWSQFNLTFGDPYSTTGSSGSDGGLTEGGGAGEFLAGDGNGNGSVGGGLPTDGLFSFGNDALRYFNPGVKLFGDRRPLDIVGAIKFLSTYGETAVDQNVELRTLAGTAVNWRSGETIPYVSGVSATTGFNGGGSGGGGFGGGAVGAAQTETLETGLTLDLAPNYEANGGLVTVAFELELTELVEMVELNAGNQLGTFTQPRTREQKLDDIVRIPVGETVVLGGLRRQVASTNRNGPLSLYSIGSKNKRSETQTVFIIMRPSVTVYEVEGLTHSLPSRIGDITVNADGSAWEPQAGDYRGTNMFGASTDTPGPERRRSMAQPEKSNDD
ncbi:hypothetical protein [Erythrobacter aureus]|uniref:Type II/III secretion system secretin-like domain-containing protein n=1 Tax=Erythrobacter aureus TaxID=2182384 RepID=A0A345YJK4_9SPHN|nr:hypothetical protein [Erythrobacter aureus]AXK44106.1 hypothetical protein DVR09_16775 [Erythrobacter aureus]